MSIELNEQYFYDTMFRLYDIVNLKENKDYSEIVYKFLIRLDNLGNYFTDKNQFLDVLKNVLILYLSLFDNRLYYNEKIDFSKEEQSEISDSMISFLSLVI